MFMQWLGVMAAILLSMTVLLLWLWLWAVVINKAIAYLFSAQPKPKAPRKPSSLNKLAWLPLFIGAGWFAFLGALIYVDTRTPGITPLAGWIDRALEGTIGAITMGLVIFAIGLAIFAFSLSVHALRTLTAYVKTQARSRPWRRQLR